MKATLHCRASGAVILYLVASCGNTKQKGALQAFRCHSIKVQEISICMSVVEEVHHADC